MLAKLRVAPNKMGNHNLQQTISRLELLAAVVNAHAIAHVCSALSQSFFPYDVPTSAVSVIKSVCINTTNRDIQLNLLLIG